MKKQLNIFVDSDAFIALIKHNDSNHQRAKLIFEKLQDTTVNFITSNYVFSEVITVLSQRVDHQTAIIFIQNMQSGDNMFVIERIDREAEEKAVQIFINQTSKNVSFVDCTNIALIKQKGLDGIFSFDEDYKNNGVQLIENLI